MTAKRAAIGLILFACVGFGVAKKAFSSLPGSPPTNASSGPIASPVAPATSNALEDRELDEAARAPATSVRMAPSSDGTLGAWLVAGPYRSATFASTTKSLGSEALDSPPPGVDESAIAPNLGTSFGPPIPKNAKNKSTTPAAGQPSWQIAFANEGAIDVKSALAAKEGDVIAYAAATLHLERAGHFTFLVGTDDGLRVSIDGRVLLTRDEARPERDDDDMIPIDLAAGDHKIVLKLHQREGAWVFHTRLLDRDLNPPIGAYLDLPGTTAQDARALASKMSWVSIDRGLTTDADYAPKLTVRFLEGAPRGVPLHVSAKLVRDEKRATSAPWFDVNAGDVPIDASGVGELVVSLPPISSKDVAAFDDHDWRYEVDVAGRNVIARFVERKATREAVAHADHAIRSIDAKKTAWLRDGSLDSVTHLKTRLIDLVAHGDLDRDAQDAEARELEAAARAIDRNIDPYEGRRGPMRRAYKTPEGDHAEFGLYVPPGYSKDSKTTWPLIVALHGMNGKALAMMRWFFGGDEPSKDQEWEDRHVDPLPRLDAFVVTPSGYGNSMYRDMGEDDVLRVMNWAIANFPIDRSRVTITGPSMGGIGAALIPFHHPDLFAAAAPLCGYHSLFVRRDVMGRPIRPWEKILAEERSNVDWAFNGSDLPLFIVQGTQDLPESNSGVLIDRYEKLGYNVEHEHPDLGHNVWQTTYADLKGAKWLLDHRRAMHPRRVRFRTIRLRDGDDAWLHVDALSAPDAWGEVDAKVVSKTLDVRSTGISSLHFDRDDKLIGAGATSVKIDGDVIAFEPGESLALHREDGAWKKGTAVTTGLQKRAGITGPIRDVFHSPILFVYGADDPSQTRANKEVARAWADVRWGMSVHYAVMSDAEFFAKNEDLANDYALFLVGNAKSNRVVRALESDFPIRVDGDAIVIDKDRITGEELGAAFIRPNPKRADRCVVVVEGVDALGTWRSLSLPDLIPDFVIYDHNVAPSRGQLLLSAGSVRAAGFFANDWSTPREHDDPLAKLKRPGARSEYDATPYLP